MWASHSTVLDGHQIIRLIVFDPRLIPHPNRACVIIRFTRRVPEATSFSAEALNVTKKTNQSNRRDWLKATSVAGAAIAFPTIVPASALGRGGAVAPSERIVLGGLGIGPRGTVDLKCFLANSDVQFVAIADLQKTRREAVKTLVDETYGNRDCVLYQDMYDVLGRGDIDALLIATGDRWHTMASVLAAKAGKDVYCEKPCSLTIAESRCACRRIP